MKYQSLKAAFQSTTTYLTELQHRITTYFAEYFPITSIFSWFIGWMLCIGFCIRYDIDNHNDCNAAMLGIVFGWLWPIWIIIYVGYRLAGLFM